MGVNMSQILLLTKNPLNEQTFEEKIYQLGHEVFSSVVLIDACLVRESNNDFLKMFTHVILSETIANAEVKKLIQKLKQYSVKILRKSDESLDDAQKKEWVNHGIDDWLDNHPDLEVLREKLIQDNTTNEGKIISLPKTDEQRSVFSLNLSGGELKLFMLLYQKEGRVVSREDLCLSMWNRSRSNSSMSQLSVMVKNLRSKVAAQTIEGPIIETCWGQGYRLHESIYDQVYVDSNELNYVKKSQ
ncbi:MAG: helix-turn-helix domain-containing protein [Enterococcus sp.]|uniref:helix-turn-helix domain-containing protein n=2 Tax=Enterococcus TaxID=1350 RepID=UPI001F07CDDC|nr:MULTISPECIES: helix-turn-helix domain-containing protein [Enterococcus]MDN6002121.1 helix-turn-helix domain-containing protein [Enterococcus sp.]MDN6216582.1 helix-turn-helix domain-containing protein [Enterococcus sp.]MDN6516970.1 helix-turn-helix domain-containing protein [Enterococcus sp.]MDN6560379.1 helix-turn-helix domain-containing protein [Enterococcus sp.]MDN6583371.1 helix-turn-helix domain-containing protein [Enterococcus sp.]